MECDIERELSEPPSNVVDFMTALEGDILFLGAAGKMGPTITSMAQRAIQAAGRKNRVMAVSRFSDPKVQESFAAQGIETIAGDLLDPKFLASLPNCENVVFMVGAKFGTSGAAAATWAANACLPGLVCQQFPTSRMACFSTGNIYGLVPREKGGSVEEDDPNPVGEYAMSCLGRERVFEYFSQRYSMPLSILRINYSTEYRYGVLVDLAQKVFAGRPIDLQMGAFNVIWQRDACAMAIKSLGVASTEPTLLNITGPEVALVRDVAERLGEHFNRPPVFNGQESSTALLSNSSKACRLFGPPEVLLEEMIARTADWIARGGVTWNKPTHFEVRDGKF